MCVLILLHCVFKLPDVSGMNSVFMQTHCMNLNQLGYNSGKHDMLTMQEVSYLIFHPLEVVSLYRDPQLQAGDNYVHVSNLRPSRCNWYLNTHFIHS